MSAERLAQFRQWMKKTKLQAFLVPATDAHQNEYLPECWERRAWLSGFDGSAGDLVVTGKSAALWTDGRYWLQAEKQLAGSGIELMRAGEADTPTQSEWLLKQLRKGNVVGADFRTLSPTRKTNLFDSVNSKGIRLKAVERNPVDALRPGGVKLPTEPVFALPTRYAGRSRQSKLKEIRSAMVAENCRHLVMGALDSIAWQLNLRGSDIPYNPVFLSYLVVGSKQAWLFTDPSRVSDSLRKQLIKAGVRLKPYDDIGPFLKTLKGRSWVDVNGASAWLVGKLKEEVHLAEGPVARLKARKNEVEATGMFDAHRRDGVAMVRFLRWLQEAVPAGGCDEISVADQLERFRSEGKDFMGLSFPTISGYGAHGAIVHYSATAATVAKLRSSGLYLVDSGAQYRDGTTDITRTVLLGEKATSSQCEHYTRVLKGHLQLGRATFPAGTPGRALDTLARGPLWDIGLDYRHGTGHGVGHFLNVHEGPQSIGPRCTGASLESGNVLSNEPGFYLTGRYGIRIENLVLVVPAPLARGKSEDWLAFKDLTLCPYERRLIDTALLSEEECAQVDFYHRRCRKELRPLLRGVDRAWLEAACAPIR